MVQAALLDGDLSAMAVVAAAGQLQPAVQAGLESEIDFPHDVPGLGVLAAGVLGGCLGMTAHAVGRVDQSLDWQAVPSLALGLIALLVDFVVGRAVCARSSSAAWWKLQAAHASAGVRDV
jgi:hypothetical protein